jgi:lipopolysaccharide transport system ATP-binding protein
VSFEVRQGETLGIIGRNGAGKSTLLKILSRITEPTEGRVRIKGRVASLLEVGTGFHPELTGRENVFLNGAILGMARTEIKRKFDEIVAFAEVEKFLDTPVKRYSSGMYVRLAFAVAAHLDPEILIVDEVLAVGDAAFQKKCLGKMQQVSSQDGRTVLFVSHNMAAVENLCSRALLLCDGALALSADANEVLRAYAALADSSMEKKAADRADRSGDGRLRVSEFSIRCRGKRCSIVPSGETLELAIEYHASAPLQNVDVQIGFFSSLGQRIAWLSNELAGTHLEQLPSKGTFLCTIDRLPLVPDRYSINVFINVNGSLADWIKDVASVQIADGDFYGSGRLPPKGLSMILLTQSWRFEPSSGAEGQATTFHATPLR